MNAPVSLRHLGTRLSNPSPWTRQASRGNRWIRSLGRRNRARICPLRKCWEASPRRRANLSGASAKRVPRLHKARPIQSVKRVHHPPREVRRHPRRKPRSRATGGSEICGILVVILIDWLLKSRPKSLLQFSRTLRPISPRTQNGGRAGTPWHAICRGIQRVTRSAPAA